MWGRWSRRKRMELVLIRHAEPESGAGFEEDAQRPLTVRGREVQERVARALKDLVGPVQTLYSSPRLRALETAEITAQVLGFQGAIEVHADLDGGQPARALVSLLQASAPGEVVVCVGHEPDMSQWALDLQQPGNARVVHFGKSSMACLSFAAAVACGQGVLRWFYRAEDLSVGSPSR